MKAYLYILLYKARWEARVSLAPQVDEAYWFGGEKQEGMEAWLYREELPLGQACLAAELWNGRERSARTIAGQHPLRRLAGIVAGLKETDARRGFAGASPGRAGSRSGSDALGHRWGRERPRGDAAGGETAALAKLAAGLLQGRALLGGEARDLLVGAAGPGAASSWREALQLLTLLGQARLRGAVAADGGGRRPAGKLRCLRCGSGEERLRRTRCQACGRKCAYCEACLTMGRSRECELLVTGVYTPFGGGSAIASSEAKPPLTVGPNPNKSLHAAPPLTASGKASDLSANCTSLDLERWKLSPAQEAAASQALAFIGDKLAVCTAHYHRKEANPTATFRGLMPIESSLIESSPIESHASRQLLSTSPDAQKQGALPQWLERVLGSSFRHVLQRTAELAWKNASPTRNRWAQHYLLWAVTGAGKTEMIFPLIETVLVRGGRALIASPRRDVVIELDPRLRKAFPDASVVTLYGGSEQRWERGDITLSTTHQLFRFHQAFDLVVIDEIDAFPYHGDPMLHYAAGKCGLPEGPIVLLSATPPRDMQAAAKRGELAHARVPVRYHRHPLPVPKLQASPTVAAMLATRKIPQALSRALRSSLDRGAQCFVFVQRIAQVDEMALMLRKALDCPQIAATSSQDPVRAEKVKAFRSCEIRVLVTTTILERGVTIPRSDVYILDADGRLFDEASLVQMAGRAGRSADDPFGRVAFFAKERNESQLRAVRHIKGMNKAARSQGYLRT